MLASTGISRTLPMTVAGIVLLSGCVNRLANDQDAPPFVFRSLDLNFRHPDGSLAWELKAPEARYDIERRLVQAVRMRGVIYERGKPLYRITAPAGTVINDGELIELEGEPRLDRLQGQATTIRADRLRWTPKSQLIEMQGAPRALQRDLEITAEQARFLIAEDKLELRGKPTLRHWQKRLKGSSPRRQQDVRTPDLLLRVVQADWHPGSGQLRASGPAVAKRRQAGQRQLQTLTASALEGNTKTRTMSLLAPVRAMDPARDAVIKAQRTELDLDAQTLSSVAPFTARTGPSQAWGDAFLIDFSRQIARVPAGCHLSQPQESLSANQCQWDWKRRHFAASGSVELRRMQPQQITRSSVLQGRLGPQGEAVFTSPGGRVMSTLRIPPRAPKPARRAPAIGL